MESIFLIEEYSQKLSQSEFSLNRTLQDAIIRRLEIIGEAAYLLTKEYKTEHSEIEWSELIGMRHVLVHGYYQIRDEIIWATVETELKPLRKQVAEILTEL